MSDINNEQQELSNISDVKYLKLSDNLLHPLNDINCRNKLVNLIEYLKIDSFSFSTCTEPEDIAMNLDTDAYCLNINFKDLTVNL